MRFLAVLAAAAGVSSPGPAVAVRALGAPARVAGGPRGGGAAAGPQGLGACPVCGSAEVVGRTPPGLAEASGLAASARHPGIHYAINDDPDTGEIPALYAIRETGEVVRAFSLTGFNPENAQVWSNGGHVDVEAIQTGWCIESGILRPGSCIIVGNVGHNCIRVSGKRCPWMRKSGRYALWQFHEPEELAGRPGLSSSLSGEQFWFRFPDGELPHDIETMLAGSAVAGGTGELLVVTKENAGPSGVYLLPAFTEDNSMAVPAVLSRVAEIPSLSASWWRNLITDGSVREGRGVTLMSYTDLLFYPRIPGESLTKALQGRPCHLPHPYMKQSEGFTWDTDSAGVPFYLLVGEGASSKIHRVRCSFEGNATLAGSAVAPRSAVSTGAVLAAASGVAATVPRM